jgi:hypothetical protein
MQADSNRAAGYRPGCVNPYTEALVLLAVFREAAGYPRARLDRDLADLDPVWVSESVDSLQEAGVIVIDRATLYPSAQLTRLTALDVICF